eukprot:sb/3473678/
MSLFNKLTVLVPETRSRYILSSENIYFSLLHFEKKEDGSIDTFSSSSSSSSSQRISWLYALSFCFLTTGMSIPNAPDREMGISISYSFYYYDNVVLCTMLQGLHPHRDTVIHAELTYHDNVVLCTMLQGLHPEVPEALCIILHYHEN